MKNALLICDDPNLFPDAGDPAYESLMAEYDSFTRELIESGERVDGLRLAEGQMATSVRVRRDEIIVTDWPFAETREHLGGFYIVDVVSRERAIELAALQRRPTGTRSVCSTTNWHAFIEVRWSSSTAPSPSLKTRVRRPAWPSWRSLPLPGSWLRTTSSKRREASCWPV